MAAAADKAQMAYDVGKQPGEWGTEQAARLAGEHHESAWRWLRGANAECLVGYTLARLRSLGFVVMHDLAQPGEGNVDHLVSGPSGVFMIETKWRRYEDRHLPKAKRQAKKLHDELGVWVTPLICLATRAVARPYCNSGVWIVGRKQLVDWLRIQRNPVVESSASRASPTASSGVAVVS